MPRCRFQPDQWAQWIQDRSFSNFSVADFCANHQLPVHSFYFWRRKLASHSKPKKRKNLADAKLAENALQFIPLATSGLLAQVVVSKFGDHLPGYRQEDIFSRHGMEMRRCTLYDWVSGVADLCLPLYQRMQQRVLESFSIHTDDTTVKLVDKHLRSTKPARFWCYQGDAEHPYA